VFQKSDVRIAVGPRSEKVKKGGKMHNEGVHPILNDKDMWVSIVHTS
jgi:hypothetical protein